MILENINVVFAIMCLRWYNKEFSVILWRLKSDADFRGKRCLEKSLDESVLLREVQIEPNVKLECVPKFCYLDG